MRIRGLGLLGAILAAREHPHDSCWPREALPQDFRALSAARLGLARWVAHLRLNGIVSLWLEFPCEHSPCVACASLGHPFRWLLAFWRVRAHHRLRWHLSLS